MQEKQVIDPEYEEPIAQYSQKHDVQLQEDPVINQEYEDPVS